MEKPASFIPHPYQWLSVVFLWLSVPFISCDSGDIYPDEFEYENGVVVKASFTFEELGTFPSSYQVLFGAFGDGKVEPIVSKTIVKPRQGQEVTITLSNLPDDATSLKLCLTTLGKQPVYTFYRMDVPANTGDSIVIPAQEIHLMQFDRIQQQVLTPGCVACHGSSGAAGLNLSEGASYASLVNVAATRSAEPKNRVTPSDVAGSFLINILEHGDLLKTDHTSIPSKYNDDLTLLKEWISNGARK
jgi:hypothetical protein